MNPQGVDHGGGRGRSTGSQLIVGLAFLFLAAAVFGAIYLRISGVDDVSIGMVGEEDQQVRAEEDDQQVDTTSATVAETTATDNAAPTSVETTTTSQSLETPVATGAPMKGVLRDGRVRLTGSVPDIETGRAFTRLIEGFVGEGNVDEFFTLSEDSMVPNSFTLQIVDNVLFEPGGETVAPTSFPLLDQIVSFMSLDPNVTLVVEGHTDTTGSQVENLALSQRRADAVSSYLAEQGVNEFRLEAQGKGDSDPVADNSTPEGREQNRRIEFQLVGFQVRPVTE